MDDQRFDAMVRRFAELADGAKPATRRAALRRLIGGALLGSVVKASDVSATERRERPEPRTRPRRCRTAGNCRAGEICQDGRCFSCWPTKIPCNNVCVDPLSDRTNCGDCGIVCADDQVCGDGFCGQPCTDNFDCPDNLDYHCEIGICTSGACTIVAPDCMFGQPKQDCCKSADAIFCVDWATDPDHCGRCYNNCGDAGCCNGTCCDE